MEEGNLMDRVPILLQRDLQYYQVNNIIVQSFVFHSKLNKFQF